MRNQPYWPGRRQQDEHQAPSLGNTVAPDDPTAQVLEPHMTSVGRKTMEALLLIRSRPARETLRRKI